MAAAVVEGERDKGKARGQGRRAAGDSEEGTVSGGARFLSTVVCVTGGVRCVREKDGWQRRVEFHLNRRKKQER